MGTAIKHPVPDRVKTSFVIFDTRTSGHSERQSARMSKITNDGFNPVWHRMLYSCSCTHMATVGVKGLRVITDDNWMTVIAMIIWVIRSVTHSWRVKSSFLSHDKQLKSEMIFFFMAAACWCCTAVASPGTDPAESTGWWLLSRFSLRLSSLTCLSISEVIASTSCFRGRAMTSDWSRVNASCHSSICSISDRVHTGTCTSPESEYGLRSQHGFARVAQHCK